MPHGLRVPASLQRDISRGFGGASGPIGGAREADGIAHAVMHALEMRQGDLTVVQKAQCDPTGQPFAVRKAGAAIHAVITGQPISFRDETVRQHAARQDLFLPPPQLGADEVLGLIAKQRDGVRVPVLGPSPAQPFVNEAWVVEQPIGNLGNGRVDIAGAGPQQHPGFADQTGIALDPE